MEKVKICAAVFDCDGVVLDTLGLYYKALTYIVPPPYPQTLVNEVNGRSDLDVCRIFIKHFKLDYTPEELNRKRNEILATLLPESEFVHGVTRVIKEIHKLGIPLAIATSSSREMHQSKISKHKDIFDLFDATICGDEVKLAKPEPFIFQQASKKLGDFKPENVIVFEDAYHGIKAANRAGMHSVFLATEDMKDVEENFKKVDAKPDLIIRSFDEFNLDNFEWVSPK